jgi:hypothetical protein
VFKYSISMVTWMHVRAVRHRRSGPAKLLPATGGATSQHQTSLRHDRHWVSSGSARSRSCLHTVSMSVVNARRYVLEGENGYLARRDLRWMFRSKGAGANCKT